MFYSSSFFSVKVADVTEPIFYPRTMAELEHHQAVRRARSMDCESLESYLLNLRRIGLVNLRLMGRIYLYISYHHVDSVLKAIRDYVDETAELEQYDLMANKDFKPQKRIENVF